MISTRLKFIAMNIVAGGALLMAALAPAAATGTTYAACQMFNFKAIMSGGLHNTTAMSYANLPEAGVTFYQGGKSASCVVVLFTAQVGAKTPQNIMVRATLDGVPAAFPNEVNFNTADPTQYDTRAATFIFPSVALGTHTVRLQWLSSTGISVFMERFTTFVYFAP